jgi:arylsulfatase A-like enzyme
MTRRELLKAGAAIGAAAALPRFAHAARASSQPPNVLFLCSDDLNDWIAPLRGHPQVKTPNFDRLAARGTTFANAYCPAPLCTPSRTSVLSGLRPSTIGCYGLSPGIRDFARTKNHVTLPQAFTRAGYHSSTCGKVYHNESLKPGQLAAEFNVCGPTPPPPRPARPLSKLPEPHHPLMDWGVFPARDEEMADYQTASAAVAALRQAPRDQPFFVAAGFISTHVPCFAPAKWFEMYPDETLQMPPILETDRDDTPRFSWYLHWSLPEPRLNLLRQCSEWRPLVRAYLATVSFLDAQLGRVLDALETTGRADNTIIVFWGDHGWHLGEKGISGKNTLWERSTHVPLFLAGPGVARGARCTRPVETLDVFPTLLDLAGLPARSDLEGHSLAALCRDANGPRPWPAITTHNQGNHAVRTEQWRYIHYADDSEELYDVRADPNEWTNVAGRPEHAATLRDLRQWLPKIDLPPGPGSRSRVLTYDRASGIATWEGKPIRPTDPVPGMPTPN